MRTIPLTAAAALAALAAAPAFAGGFTPLPAEPIVQAPAPAIIAAGSDWTGGYAGLQAGYGKLDSQAGDDEGAVYGVHAGYDYDFGSFVIGAEAAYSETDLETGAGTGEFDNLTQVKARVGYDAGRTLVYGTAGAAFAKADFGGTSFDDTGFVYGVGADFKVTDRVTVGAEVLQNDFGDDFGGSGFDADLTQVNAKVSMRF